MDLTNKQWAILKPLIPELGCRPDGKGKPWRPNREVLNGILCILKTGVRWQDLPERHPPYQTCHRRFQRWVRNGVFETILKILAEDMMERGKLDLREGFIDSTFKVAKKGDSEWERPSGAKVGRSWQWQMVLVFLSPSTQKVLRRMKSPLSSQLLSPALRRLVRSTL